MSRLYYPRPIVATLVSGSGSVSLDPGEVFRKIGQLIPTELVAGYGALVSASLALHWEGLREPFAWACFVLCWILTPLYLNKVADRGKPKRNQIIVGTLAFPIWAYQVSGNQVIQDYYDGSLALILALVFSLVTVFVPMNK